MQYRSKYRNYFRHSAKGSTWEKHKYLKRIDGTYYYPDNYDGGRHLSDLEDKDRQNDQGRPKNLDLTSEEIDRTAREVIRGGFGNGQVRKDLLGDNYEAVQKRVNELMSKVGKTKVTEVTDAAVEKMEEVVEKTKAKSKKKSKSNVHSGIDLDRVMSVYDKRKKR